MNQNFGDMLTQEIVNDIELVYRTLWDMHSWGSEDDPTKLDLALMRIDAWMDTVRGDHIAQAAETERNRILDIIAYDLDPAEYTALGYRRRLVKKIEAI